MTLSKKQLDSTFTTALLVSFAIALTLALLIVQLGAQVMNTLDNLVISSMRPTLSLPEAIIPFGLISGTTSADDILVEWKVKHENIRSENVNSAKIDSIDPAIAESTTPISDAINFPETVALQDLDLTGFSIRDLKDLAKLRGIVGYSKMTKAKLIKTLQ